MVLILLWLFGKPILAVFETGFALVFASIDDSPNIIDGADFHSIVVFEVCQNAVFLLFAHSMVFRGLFCALYSVPQYSHLPPRSGAPQHLHTCGASGSVFGLITGGGVIFPIGELISGVSIGYSF
jgi:hypothetical protein